jgi:hypothetical protein
MTYRQPLSAPCVPYIAYESRPFRLQGFGTSTVLLRPKKARTEQQGGFFSQITVFFNTTNSTHFFFASSSKFSRTSSQGSHRVHQKNES